MALVACAVCFLVGCVGGCVTAAKQYEKNAHRLREENNALKVEKDLLTTHCTAYKERAQVAEQQVAALRVENENLSNKLRQVQRQSNAQLKASVEREETMMRALKAKDDKIAEQEDDMEKQRKKIMALNARVKELQADQIEQLENQENMLNTSLTKNRKKLRMTH